MNLAIIVQSKSETKRLCLQSVNSSLSRPTNDTIQDHAYSQIYSKMTENNFPKTFTNEHFSVKIDGKKNNSQELKFS